MKQEAAVRVKDEESDPCTIGRGVRQGSTLPPLLFSIYAEMMMAGLHDVNEGVNVGGELFKTVRFAYHQGMVSETENGLQIKIDRVNWVSKEDGMEINVKKTKVVFISRQGGRVVNINLNGKMN